MELVITPSVCTTQKDEAGADIAPSFIGTVTIKLPTMPQSLRFKAKYGKRMRERESELKASGKDVKEVDSFEVIELMADIADDIAPFLQKVDLTEIATQKKIVTLDELMSYEPSFPILSEVAIKFVTGFAEKNS